MQKSDSLAIAMLAKAMGYSTLSLAKSLVKICHFAITKYFAKRQYEWRSM